MGERDLDDRGWGPSESTGRVLEKQRGSPWEASGQSLGVYEEEYFGDGGKNAGSQQRDNEGNGT